MNKKLLIPLLLILVIMLYFSVLEPTTVNWKELNSFASNITSYAFSPIGTLLAAGSPDGSVTL